MITPKHRAVSVKVDNVIGVAGFVTPGARVDVLVTLARVDLSDALPFSKVFLQNIRVLAVDQKLEEVKSGDPELVSVVTLEVTPVQAEHLTYAAHEGPPARWSFGTIPKCRRNARVNSGIGARATA